MILSDRTIKQILDSGELGITNLDPDGIQPASVDITVGTSFRYIAHETGVINMDYPVDYVEVETEVYKIPPKGFVLATTEQYFKIPNGITAFVEGRSSIGRIGLFIQNAGWVDPGFEGQITLELYNATDQYIAVNAGTRVGQLVFASMTTLADKPYCGKYQGQSGATGSRLYMDFVDLGGHK